MRFRYVFNNYKRFNLLLLFGAYFGAGANGRCGRCCNCSVVSSLLGAYEITTTGTQAGTWKLATPVVCCQRPTSDIFVLNSRDPDDVGPLQLHVEDCSSLQLVVTTLLEVCLVRCHFLMLRIQLE